ncbi:hypothetical protein PU560_00080, partial [Georgenia sp. 10Sc9-8]|nr:hypothetical protein [Georgenia halotolerans]
MRNSLSAGPADEAVRYGRTADTVLVGDWDGDGDDTFTVRRGVKYYIANDIRGGDADDVVSYGRR